MALSYLYTLPILNWLVQARFASSEESSACSSVLSSLESVESNTSEGEQWTHVSSFSNPCRQFSSFENLSLFLSTAIFLPSHDWGMGNWRPQKSFVIPIVAAFKGSPSSDVTLCWAMWQRGDCARALFIAGLNQGCIITIRNVAKIFLCSKIVVG